MNLVLDSNLLKRRVLRAFFFPIILVFAVSSCAGSATKKKAAPIVTSFTSEARLKEIGAEAHLKLQPALYKDESLLEYVRDVGSRLVKVSELPDFGFQFFILDTMDVNAFAITGGYIYVTRGILGLSFGSFWRRSHSDFFDSVF